MTTYKVLMYSTAAGCDWTELSGTYEAANDEAAIKAALLSGNGAGDPSVSTSPSRCAPGSRARSRRSRRSRSASEPRPA